MTELTSHKTDLVLLFFELIPTSFSLLCFNYSSFCLAYFFAFSMIIVCTCMTYYAFVWLLNQIFSLEKNYVLK